VALLKLLGNCSDIFNSRLGQFGQQVKISEQDVSRFLNFGGAFCFLDQLLDVGWLDHEVDFVTGSTLELDGTRGLVAVQDCPHVSHGLVSAEHTTVQTDEGLADHGLVFGVASLNTHHGGQGATSGSPVGGVFVGEVHDAGHVAGDTFTDENSSVQTEGVAVLGIEVGWESASALVTKEVTQRLEFTGVLFRQSALSKLSLQKQDQKFFSVDLGDLYISVGVAIQKQLATDRRGQEVEKFFRAGGQALGHVSSNLAFEGLGEDLVDLFDQDGHLGDEFNEAFGH